VAGLARCQPVDLRGPLHGAFKKQTWEEAMTDTKLVHPDKVDILLYRGCFVVLICLDVSC